MSCENATVYSGDTRALLVRIRKSDGAAFVLSVANDTVRAAWIDRAANAAITATATQASSLEGADWPNGLVGVAFNATESAKLAKYDGKTVELEIEVDSSVYGKRTFVVSFAVRKGFV